MSGHSSPGPGIHGYEEEVKFTDRCYTTPDQTDYQEPYFQKLNTILQDPEQAFDFSEYCHDKYADTAIYPHRMPVPTSSIESGEDFPHHLRHPELISNTLAQDVGLLSRDVKEHTEVTSLDFRNPQRRSVDFATQHNVSQPISVTYMSEAPIQSTATRTETERPQLDLSPRDSQYAYCSGRFQTTESAKAFRKSFTYFDRKPYWNPGEDASIKQITQNRQLHVERIYNAMTSGGHARDNQHSVAMKRWVLNAHYTSDLVEAYAHKVFDCLIEQVNYGFRGWIHNDYVADDRKQEGDDKDVNCAERLNNIIGSLEQEKTICEDVMNSGCQIRMFVNAPKAYANRKLQNRVGNSKRRRTKDAESDEGERQTKARKPSSGTMTRPQASSKLLAPGGARYPTPTPEPQAQNRARPNYETPPAQSISSPSNTRYSMPSPSAVTHPFNNQNSPLVSSGMYQVNAMSPPPVFSPQLQSVATMVPRHQLFMSPSQSLPTGRRSAPFVPDEARLVNDNLEVWPPMQSVNQQYSPSYQSYEHVKDPYWGLSVESAKSFDPYPDTVPPIDPTLHSATPDITVNFAELMRIQQSVRRPRRQQLSEDEISKRGN